MTRHSLLTVLKSRLFDTVAIGAIGILFVYVLIITANVVARYVFRTPIQMVSDLGEIMVPLSLGLTFAAASMKGTHLSIQFLGNRLGGRGYVALEILGRSVLFILMGAITWQMSRYAYDMAISGRTTVQFEIAIWPVWAFVAVAFALSTLGIVFSRVK